MVDGPDAALTRADLLGHPARLAPALLGCRLLVLGADGQVEARIVEVEAYGSVGEDPGSHAHRGRTRRNATMFGPVGHLYVYFTYGMHWCANVVVHQPEFAGAVLLRAARITTGVAVVRARRGMGVVARDLARGPARLTMALGLTGEHDGVDLISAASPLRLARGPAPAEVSAGPRVGVGGEGAATPWRWWETASPEVSAYRPAALRRPRITKEGPP